MDNIDYYYYKSKLNLSLPDNYQVPAFIEKSFSNCGGTAYCIKVLLKKIQDTIKKFEEEIIWQDQTRILLSELASTLPPIINSMEKINSEKLQIVKNSNERFQRYHNYFNINETAGMDVTLLAKQDAEVLYWMICEMKDIAMDEFEIINFLNAATIRWNFFIQILYAECTNEMDIPEENQAIAIKNPRIDNSQEATSFFRWFICHYDFAFNTIHAKYQITNCLKNFKEKNYEVVAHAINNAGILIRGTSADLVFSSKFPRVIYQNVIRPSMGLGFTGKDNPQWSSFSESLEQLINLVVAYEIPVVVEKALKNFLENYLQDIEVHVWVAAKQVGSKPSLTQEEINEYLEKDMKNDRPATEDLRTLHYVRLKKFEFLEAYKILYSLFNKKK